MGSSAIPGLGGCDLVDGLDHRHMDIAEPACQRGRCSPLEETVPGYSRGGHPQPHRCVDRVGLEALFPNGLLRALSSAWPLLREGQSPFWSPKWGEDT